MKVTVVKTNGTYHVQLNQGYQQFALNYYGPKADVQWYIVSLQFVPHDIHYVAECAVVFVRLFR